MRGAVLEIFEKDQNSKNPNPARRVPRSKRKEKKQAEKEAKN